jgi:hypothetical protein
MQPQGSQNALLSAAFARDQPVERVRMLPRTSNPTIGHSWTGLATPANQREARPPGRVRGFLVSGGEGGIRTRERLLTPTRFPGVPVRPLQHLSAYHFAFANRPQHMPVTSALMGRHRLLAERVGFEPTVQFPGHRFSRAAP